MGIWLATRHDDGDYELSSTAVDKLADDLTKAIIAGEFAPGSRLDEQQLAQRYSVSRTPVREALRQLATSGLIEIRPRRGAVVTQVTPTQLEELFVAMAELEATCARLAALSMAPTERRRLQDLHERMEKMAKDGDVPAFTDANHYLHTMIYAGAHNAVLADMAAAMRRRLSPFRRAQFRVEGRLPRSHAEHGTVVRAIIQADAQGAHAAMLQHVTLVEQSFEELCAASTLAPLGLGS
ncbi:transcriptional regulator, GntR family [Novosphingobium sp. CF614]|uniref:GntR family transcriptional regulator n=1 Tax=Novosphingobium sp. CF614 TaxID=1884364 RepID=UPI0008DFBA6C|nr:GntR family transcriptional regulator [Novosphingobium sp. CF614]SFG18176.1 transcriptional regulator, GntR family [Novosphingobium sp. CF614]